MKSFGGPLLFLDRSDINTDEIIPAKYLTEVSKEALKPHLLEDLKLEGFDPSAPSIKEARVVVTRSNFGCGSSREHAPWALEVNGITAVIAESFARIFRQNMFNCGMLAIELEKETLDKLFSLQSKEGLSCEIDLEKSQIQCLENGTVIFSTSYSVDEFGATLVQSGGWVDFADSRY